MRGCPCMLISHIGMHGHPYKYLITQLTFHKSPPTQSHLHPHTLNNCITTTITTIFFETSSLCMMIFYPPKAPTTFTKMNSHNPLYTSISKSRGSRKVLEIHLQGIVMAKVRNQGEVVAL